MRLVTGYLQTGSAERAAAIAGFYGNQAVKAADHLLYNPDMQAEVARRMAAYEVEDHEVRGRIIATLKAIAFTGLSELTVVDENGLATINLLDATPEQLDIVQELQCEEVATGRGEDRQVIIKSKIKLYDKLKAIELLNKMLGFNEPERVEIAGAGGGPVRLADIAAVDPSEAARTYAEIMRADSGD